jgi:hypothetical protein
MPQLGTCQLCGYPVLKDRLTETETMMLSPQGINIVGSCSFNPTQWHGALGYRKEALGCFSARRLAIKEDNTYSKIRPIYSIAPLSSVYTGVSFPSGGQWEFRLIFGPEEPKDGQKIDLEIKIIQGADEKVFLREGWHMADVKFYFNASPGPATVRLTSLTPEKWWWFDCAQICRPYDDLVYTSNGPREFPYKKPLRVKIIACEACLDEALNT